MTERLVTVGLAVLALAVVASGSAAAQSGTASPTCGDGNDTGILYAADSGLSVIDDAGTAPPANGTIRDNTTVRVGNLTLSADGNASVRVENATAPACLAAVDATETPLTVALDGVSVVVDGTAERLAIDTADGDLALAYDATESLTLTVSNASFEAGTAVTATDDAGSTLATGTVSETGTLRLSLPSGSASVALTADESDGSGGGGDGSDDDGSDGSDDTSSGTDDDGEETDDGGETTPTDGATPDRTDDATPSDEPTDRATPSGPDAAASPASGETEPADEPTTTGGAGPGFGIAVAVAGLLGGLGARRRG